MEVCKQALENSSTETTEYEAVGINVGKKLEKMNSSQAIYAESLINIILRNGLLNQLTPSTVISENQQNNTFAEMNTCCSYPSPSCSTSNYSTVDSHIQLSPTADNSQINTAQFYEQSQSLLNLEQL
jgi:spore maturation protein SpmA